MVTVFYCIYGNPERSCRIPEVDKLAQAFCRKKPCHKLDVMAIFRVGKMVFPEIIGDVPGITVGEILDHIVQVCLIVRELVHQVKAFFFCEAFTLACICAFFLSHISHRTFAGFIRLFILFFPKLLKLDFLLTIILSGIIYNKFSFFL